MDLQHRHLSCRLLSSWNLMENMPSRGLAADRPGILIVYRFHGASMFVITFRAVNYSSGWPGCRASTYFATSSLDPRTAPRRITSISLIEYISIHQLGDSPRRCLSTVLLHSSIRKVLDRARNSVREVHRQVKCRLYSFEIYAREGGMKLAISNSIREREFRSQCFRMAPNTRHSIPRNRFRQR